jgi:HAE1 family hydrophobic/amphiphilic exporter-1
MLGLFMLFGIVKKNGILQVDYSNQIRSRGLELGPAILEANRTRLRPILMTTVMLVAAMVPMALGRGPGAGTRASMAKVILGGQALSLVLTLLVTPVAYSLFDSMGSWIRRWGVRTGTDGVEETEKFVSHDGMRHERGDDLTGFVPIACDDGGGGTLS